MNNELMATYMMITFLVVLPLLFSFIACMIMGIKYFRYFKDKKYN